MVDDQDLVGQIEHEVALALRALQRVLDRVELEGEVVAEGAVEAEIGVLVGAEERGQRAQHGEHRRHARALLLGEDAAGLGHDQRQAALGRLRDGHVLRAPKMVRAMKGSITSPRLFSASMRMARPRAEMTSGGSMMAVSQRV